MIVILVAIITGIGTWLLKGYINYESYYYQYLIASYLDRNGLPYPTHDDFKESEKELAQSRWTDIKLCVIKDRFPFNRIPVKYLPF